VRTASRVELIPALDLLDGAAVRLLRGSYRDVTVYAVDALDAVAWLAAEGATLVHVVDLDAARGRPRDGDTLERIASSGLRFQVGGGIRTPEDAASAIAAGAEAVVIGSTITEGGPHPEAIVETVGVDRVVAAIDVRDGRARGSGWLDSGTPLVEVVDRVVALGVTQALVTGIERDGTMEGPDVSLLERVRSLAPDLGLIASGGVGSIDDLHTIRESHAAVGAVVVGKALYERRFTLAAAHASLGRSAP
jgi:phosphoribosylformimino-5-aminoimidazole carboxamide ribotide isomerase